MSPPFCPMLKVCGSSPQPPNDPLKRPAAKRKAKGHGGEWELTPGVREDSAIVRDKAARQQPFIGVRYTWCSDGTENHEKMVRSHSLPPIHFAISLAAHPFVGQCLLVENQPLRCLVQARLSGIATLGRFMARTHAVVPLHFQRDMQQSIKQQ